MKKLLDKLMVKQKWLLLTAIIVATATAAATLYSPPDRESEAATALRKQKAKITLNAKDAQAATQDASASSATQATQSGLTLRTAALPDTTLNVQALGDSVIGITILDPCKQDSYADSIVNGLAKFKAAVDTTDNKVVPIGHFELYYARWDGEDSVYTVIERDEDTGLTYTLSQDDGDSTFTVTGLGEDHTSNGKDVAGTTLLDSIELRVRFIPADTAFYAKVTPYGDSVNITNVNPRYFEIPEGTGGGTYTFSADLKNRKSGGTWELYLWVSDDDSFAVARDETSGLRYSTSEGTDTVFKIEGITSAYRETGNNTFDIRVRYNAPADTTLKILALGTDTLSLKGVTDDNLPTKIDNGKAEFRAFIDTGTTTNKVVPVGNLLVYYVYGNEAGDGLDSALIKRDNDTQGEASYTVTNSQGDSVVTVTGLGPNYTSKLPSSVDYLTDSVQLRVRFTQDDSAFYAKVSTYSDTVTIKNVYPRYFVIPEEGGGTYKFSAELGTDINEGGEWELWLWKATNDSSKIERGGTTGLRYSTTAETDTVFTIEGITSAYRAENSNTFDIRVRYNAPADSTLNLVALGDTLTLSGIEGGLPTKVKNGTVQFKAAIDTVIKPVVPVGNLSVYYVYYNGSGLDSATIIRDNQTANEASFSVTNSEGDSVVTVTGLDGKYTSKLPEGGTAGLTDSVQLRVRFTQDDSAFFAKVTPYADTVEVTNVYPRFFVIPTGTTGGTYSFSAKLKEDIAEGGTWELYAWRATGDSLPITRDATSGLRYSTTVGTDTVFTVAGLTSNHRPANSNTFDIRVRYTQPDGFPVKVDALGDTVTIKTGQEGFVPGTEGDYPFTAAITKDGVVKEGGTWNLYYYFTTGDQKDSLEIERDGVGIFYTMGASNNDSLITIKNATATADSTLNGVFTVKVRYNAIEATQTPVSIAAISADSVNIKEGATGNIVIPEDDETTYTFKAELAQGRVPGGTWELYYYYENSGLDSLEIPRNTAATNIYYTTEDPADGDTIFTVNGITEDELYQGKLTVKVRYTQPETGYAIVAVEPINVDSVTITNPGTEYLLTDEETYSFEAKPAKGVATGGTWELFYTNSSSELELIERDLSDGSLTYTVGEEAEHDSIFNVTGIDLSSLSVEELKLTVRYTEPTEGFVKVDVKAIDTDSVDVTDAGDGFLLDDVTSYSFQAKPVTATGGTWELYYYIDNAGQKDSTKIDRNEGDIHYTIAEPTEGKDSVFTVTGVSQELALEGIITLKVRYTAPEEAPYYPTWVTIAKGSLGDTLNNDLSISIDAPGRYNVSGSVHGLIDYATISLEYWDVTKGGEPDSIIKNSGIENDVEFDDPGNPVHFAGTVTIPANLPTGIDSVEVRVFYRVPAPTPTTVTVTAQAGNAYVAEAAVNKVGDEYILTGEVTDKGIRGGTFEFEYRDATPSELDTALATGLVVANVDFEAGSNEFIGQVTLSPSLPETVTGVLVKVSYTLNYPAVTAAIGNEGDTITNVTIDESYTPGQYVLGGAVKDIISGAAFTLEFHDVTDDTDSIIANSGISGNAQLAGATTGIEGFVNLPSNLADGIDTVEVRVFYRVPPTPPTYYPGVKIVKGDSVTIITQTPVTADSVIFSGTVKSVIAGANFTYAYTNKTGQTISGVKAVATLTEGSSFEGYVLVDSGFTTATDTVIVTVDYKLPQGTIPVVVKSLDGTVDPAADASGAGTPNATYTFKAKRTQGLPADGYSFKVQFETNVGRYFDLPWTQSADSTAAGEYTFSFTVPNQSAALNVIVSYVKNPLPTVKTTGNSIMIPATDSVKLVSGGKYEVKVVATHVDSIHSNYQLVAAYSEALTSVSFSDIKLDTFSATVSDTVTVTITPKANVDVAGINVLISYVLMNLSTDINVVPSTGITASEITPAGQGKVVNGAYAFTVKPIIPGGKLKVVLTANDGSGKTLADSSHVDVVRQVAALLAEPATISGDITVNGPDDNGIYSVLIAGLENVNVTATVSYTNPDLHYQVVVSTPTTGLAVSNYAPGNDSPSTKQISFDLKLSGNIRRGGIFGLLFKDREGGQVLNGVVGSVTTSITGTAPNFDTTYKAVVSNILVTDIYVQVAYTQPDVDEKGNVVAVPTPPTAPSDFDYTQVGLPVGAGSAAAGEIALNTTYGRSGVSTSKTATLVPGQHLSEALEVNGAAIRPEAHDLIITFSGALATVLQPLVIKNVVLRYDAITIDYRFVSSTRDLVGTRGTVQTRATATESFAVINGNVVTVYLVGIDIEALPKVGSFAVLSTDDDIVVAITEWEVKLYNHPVYLVPDNVVPSYGYKGNFTLNGDFPDDGTLVYRLQYDNANAWKSYTTKTGILDSEIERLANGELLYFALAGTADQVPDRVFIYTPKTYNNVGGGNVEAPTLARNVNVHAAAVSEGLIDFTAVSGQWISTDGSFSFIVTPTNPIPGYVLNIQFYTKEWITVTNVPEVFGDKTPNEDGSFTVTLKGVKVSDLQVVVTYTGAVGNDNVEADKVWTNNGTLFINSTTNSIAKVYSVAGGLVKSVKVDANTLTTAELPQGVYIVTLNGKTTKVSTK